MNDLCKIFLVDTAEINQLFQQPNDPHTHTYEELIVGVEGGLEHFIDFKSTYLQSPFVSFVTKGKVHRVQPVTSSGKHWVIRFRSEFIPETIFQLYSIYHDNANLQLNNEICFQRIILLCELMHGEIIQPNPDYAVLRQLLGTLFTMIESERRKQQPEKESWSHSSSTTFKNFLLILEENFRRPEGVEFYAEKLFMSTRNLNRICHQILQQSVSEIIETRKLIEAKNLLLSTDLSIAEIGFELGYSDKAYFTNVFRKKSGITPSEFREEMKRQLYGTNG